MAFMKKFISTHVVKILEGFEKEMTNLPLSTPLDLYVRRYLKENKKLGSHDRAEIADNVYDAIKHKVLLDTISQKPVTWESRVNLLKTDKFYNQQKNPSFLLNTRASCPKELFDLVAAEYGEGKAFDFMNIMNEKAPLTVRVNPIKTTRDDLFNLWRRKHKFNIRKTEYSPLGITFVGPNKINLFDLPEFSEGLFEIQDEGSQLCALRVECKPGQKVLDYCAGSGGKTLAFAPYMKGTGVIAVHDIRNRIMIEAKKRMKRAGIYNVQFYTEEEKLQPFIGAMDWVVLDVPCSGTGTLRRNPDVKLKFTREKLENYVDMQRNIFKNSLPYLKKDGRLVYITCSMLPQENSHQIVRFCNEYGMEVEGGQQFQTLPQSNGMDSFYSAILKFKS